MTEKLTDAEFGPEQHRQLGESLTEIMVDYANAIDWSPAGFEVENASLEFTLGDSAGILTGRWLITAKRLALD